MKTKVGVKEILKDSVGKLLINEENICCDTEKEESNPNIWEGKINRRTKGVIHLT